VQQCNVAGHAFSRCRETTMGLVESRNVPVSVGCGPKYIYIYGVRKVPGQDLKNSDLTIDNF
jgi:hypothetical protein